MKSGSLLKDKNNSYGLKIFECEIKQFQFNRFLYQLVGEDQEWFDKNTWSDVNGKSLRKTRTSEPGWHITKAHPLATMSYSNKTMVMQRLLISVWLPNSSARVLVVTFYLKQLSQHGTGRGPNEYGSIPVRLIIQVHYKTIKHGAWRSIGLRLNQRIEMLSYSCNPKKDDKGQLVIAVITITDITDRINR